MCEALISLVETYGTARMITSKLTPSHQDLERILHLVETYGTARIITSKFTQDLERILHFNFLWVNCIFCFYANLRFLDNLGMENGNNTFRERQQIKKRTDLRQAFCSKESNFMCEWHLYKPPLQMIISHY